MMPYVVLAFGAVYLAALVYVLRASGAIDAWRYHRTHRNG